MSLLSYETHINVSSHHDVIAKIKVFAEGLGWTISEYKAGFVWEDQGGGVYGWSAGSEYFLAIQSAGYGAQTLHYRLRSQADGGDANHEFIDIGANKAGETTWSTGDSTHPVDQDNIKAEGHKAVSWKPATIPQLWLFGTLKQIIVVARFDDYFVQVMHFGSVELIDSAEDEGNYISNSSSGAIEKWYDYLVTPLDYMFPYDAIDGCVLFDGVLKVSGAAKITIVSDKDNSIEGDYGRMTRALTANNYSGRRTLLKPFVYVQRVSDSAFFPIGELPIYRINAVGLAIGQQLDYGAESYLVFPSLVKDTRYYGFAIRIV